MGFFYDPVQQEPTNRGIFVIIVLLIVAVLFLIALPTGIARCGPGEVCVVRNGGWFDDKSIRKTMTPGGEYDLVGFWSQIRHYRSFENQSQYRITTNPEESDKGGVDFVQVPSKDGVQVKLQATTFFTTAFTGRDDDKLVREFDERFGNRTYDGKNVWEGTDGYRAWQDDVFRPLLNNAIRSSILTFECQELISSCALTRASKARGDIERLTAGRDNSRNFQRVGEDIALRLETNIRDALRSCPDAQKPQDLQDESICPPDAPTFLTNIRFNLEDVELPNNLQDQINRAQQANAKIAESRAEEQASKFDARKNRRLAESLRTAPELKEVRVAETYAGACKEGGECTIIVGEAQPLIGRGR